MGVYIASEPKNSAAFTDIMTEAEKQTLPEKRKKSYHARGLDRSNVGLAFSLAIASQNKSLSDRHRDGLFAVSQESNITWLVKLYLTVLHSPDWLC